MRCRDAAISALAAAGLGAVGVAGVRVALAPDHLIAWLSAFSLCY